MNNSINLSAPHVTNRENMWQREITNKGHMGYNMGYNGREIQKMASMIRMGYNG